MKNILVPIKSIEFASSFEEDVKEEFEKVVVFADLREADIRLVYINTMYNFEETAKSEEKMRAFLNHCPRGGTCSINIYNALDEEACNQKTSPESVLENEEHRQEIMDSIAHSHELMTQMMNSMMSSDHGVMEQNKGMMGNQKMMMNMMQGNPEMRKQMMQNMMQMMQSNTSAQNKMMGRMTNHKDMMKGMMEIMHEKGMMSSECMQSCMKNLDQIDMQNGMDRGN